MKIDTEHQPVLCDEVIRTLNIDPNGVYLDGTFGRGGHSQAILSQLGDEGRLIVIDKDEEAIAVAEKRFQNDERVTVHHGSYSEMGEVALREGLIGKIMGILLDLGVSSPQLDDASRGFSFMRDGPLDMRMDKRSVPSAADWLATVDETTLAGIIKEYGEERFSKRIARAICESREKKAITRTLQLADIVKKAAPFQARNKNNKNPATRTFQAIRIFINKEFEELQGALTESLKCLAKGGRLVVISFHSLEDRITKKFIQKYSSVGAYSKRLPMPESAMKHICLKSLGKIKPSEGEVGGNLRARSSMLRYAEKIV
jgi:16S rRNA (cytosine1402-N4)-methyltransferase